MLNQMYEMYCFMKRWEDGYLSASSRITILCRPGGSVTFFCAKDLILFRTTSMPLVWDEL